MLRLVGLPSVARYPEARVVREEQRLIIRFGGIAGEQTMGIPLKYTGAEDGEAAELMLLAQLQRLGYRVRRGSPRGS
ncbi:MAG: hypothetical protein M3358_16385 [Actinomycetota bacterium]|nr:hypothetical protein [Actinomycetota bacterium]